MRRLRRHDDDPYVSLDLPRSACISLHLSPLGMTMIAEGVAAGHMTRVTKEVSGRYGEM